MGKQRKHVTQSTVHQDVQPPGEHQHIVRALGSRGGNIVEVQYPDGVSTLCMMPAKFNRKLWVRRGGYLIIESSPEAQQDTSSRVTGTICAVLYEEHIKQLKKMPGVWPHEFTDAQQAAAGGQDDDLPPCSSSDIEDEAGDGADGAVDRQVPGSRSQGVAEAAAGPSRHSHTAAAAAAAAGGDDATEEEEESDDGLPPLQQINNRRVIQHYLSESDSDSEDG